MFSLLIVDVILFIKFYDSKKLVFLLPFSSKLLSSFLFFIVFSFRCHCTLYLVVALQTVAWSTGVITS